MRYSYSNVTSQTDRGFTGHEMLDAVGLIHMNGRIYDPTIGRFLSVDPVVQEAGNLQNLNRYCYVLNNPLSLTDPSGFSFFGKIGKWFEKNWKQLAAKAVGVVLGIIFAPLGPLIAAAASGFGSAFTGTLLAGGSIGDALRAGAISGLTATVPLLRESPLAQIEIRSIVSGIEAHGKEGFAHGFFSNLGQELENYAVQSIPSSSLRVLVAATIDGAKAELGGGKFLSGFASSAFAHALGEIKTANPGWFDSPILSYQAFGAGFSVNLQDQGGRLNVVAGLNFAETINPTLGNIYQSTSESLIGLSQNPPVFKTLGINLTLNVPTQGVKYGGVKSSEELTKQFRMVYGTDLQQAFRLNSSWYRRAEEAWYDLKSYRRELGHSIKQDVEEAF